MLPINLNMDKFKNNKEKEKLEKEQKNARTSCSQQSLANRLVVSSMPNNPNAGMIQQVPAKQ